MKKILMSLVFCIAAITAYSQDTIVRTNGKVIICKITKEDPSTISFNFRANGRKVETYINKIDVQTVTYYGGTPITVKHDLIPQNPSVPAESPATTNTTATNMQTTSGGNQEIKKNEISIIFGGCSAFDRFGSLDLSSETAGLAGSGVHASFSMSHYFIPELGLTMKGFLNTNIFRTDLMADEFKKEYPQITFTAEQVSYTCYGFMIGPTFSKDINRMVLGAHALLGYAGLIEPQANITARYYNQTATDGIPELRANSIVYGMGAKLGFLITSGFYISANVDYFSGSFPFGSYTKSTSEGQVTILRGTQSYSVICFSMGLGFRF